MAGPKRIEDMDLPELLNQQAAAAAPGGATEARVRTAIQVRLAELQDKSGQALVTATHQLGKTTAKLVCATWGLVGATLVLVLAELVLKLLGRP
jgi:hypothetical protein